VISNAQVWSVIGLLGATPVLTTTVLILFFNAKIDGVFGKLDTKIDGNAGKFTERFNAIDKRLDLLHRDVQAVVRRVCRQEEEGT
jgi:hypothetical protein